MIFVFAALIPFLSIAQIDPGNGTNPCDESIFLMGGGTYNCSSLTINLSVSGIYSTSAFIIKVKNDVIINQPVSFSGEDGVYPTGANGGRGGPEAGNGGGYGLGPVDGGNSINFGGMAGNNSGVCGGGGGGGSFFSVASDGTACPSGAAGGNGGTDIFDPFISSFRGGHGGGAGGEGASVTVASGGGGGGALHIMAGGQVIINANISAKGGNGGSAGTQNGGPGGGGSGGVIWIQTLGQMTNNGIIDVSGGSGGTSSFGTRGGNGGNGVFKLEDADGVISGTGSGATSSSSKLTSSISCGTLQLNEKNTFTQIGLGFFLAALLQFFGRRLKRLGYSHS